MTYDLCYSIKKSNGIITTTNIKDIKNVNNINKAIMDIKEPYIYNINLYERITENESYYDSTYIMYHYDTKRGVFYNDNENIKLDDASATSIQNKLEQLEQFSYIIKW